MTKTSSLTAAHLHQMNAEDEAIDLLDQRFDDAENNSANPSASSRLEDQSDHLRHPEEIPMDSEPEAESDTHLGQPPSDTDDIEPPLSDDEPREREEDMIRFDPRSAITCKAASPCLSHKPSASIKPTDGRYLPVDDTPARAADTERLLTEAPPSLARDAIQQRNLDYSIDMTSIDPNKKPAWAQQQSWSIANPRNGPSHSAVTGQSAGTAMPRTSTSISEVPNSR